MRQWREAQETIRALERRVHEATAQAREAADVRELRKLMSTSSLIAADKANHRLQLHRLDALPKEIMLETLQGDWQAQQAAKPGKGG